MNSVNLDLLIVIVIVYRALNNNFIHYPMQSPQPGVSQEQEGSRVVPDPKSRILTVKQLERRINQLKKEELPGVIANLTKHNKKLEQEVQTLTLSVQELLNKNNMDAQGRKNPLLEEELKKEKK